MFLFVQPIGSDVFYYYERAVRTVDLEQAPYRDFKVEYPPLAMWVLSLPAHLKGGKITPDLIKAKKATKYYPGYAVVFRFLMLVCDTLAFLLFIRTLKLVAPTRVALGATGYLVGTILLGNVIFDRLDAVLVLGLSAWAYCWVRSMSIDKQAGSISNASSSLFVWLFASYLALGCSIAYKLIPVIVVPFLLLCEIRIREQLWSRLATAIVALVIPVVFSLLTLHELSDAWQSLSFLEYHRARGIEIESTYATLLFILNQCGVPMTATHGYGGWNVESTLSMPMAKASIWLLLAGIASLGLWSFLQGDRYSRKHAFLVACCVIFLSVALSKVLSVQYLLWVLPLALIVGAMCLEDRPWHTHFWMISSMLLLSTIVFPYMFFDSFFVQGRQISNPYPLVELHWIPCTLLVVRNSLYIWLTVKLIRSSISLASANGVQTTAIAAEAYEAV